jgi:hypothetical protein
MTLLGKGWVKKGHPTRNSKYWFTTVSRGFGLHFEKQYYLVIAGSNRIQLKGSQNSRLVLG